MSDKEFGRRCQQCNKTRGDTFARMYYEPIDGKWLRLCGVCWEAVEHSVQPDRLRDAAKLSERKTVHEWLNEAGIQSEENGKPICLLRRLRIAIDLLTQSGGRYGRRI